MSNATEICENILNLTKKFKDYLDGRRINEGRINSEDKIELTVDELFMLEKALELKTSSVYSIPTIFYISSKHHLDFIGWDDSKFNDVLLCKNRK
jgi:hypothetical protein